MENVMSLLKSRKFWLLMADTVVSLVLFFVAKNSPAMLEDVKFLIAAIQPIFITIIGAIAYEDAALSRVTGLKHD